MKPNYQDEVESVIIRARDKVHEMFIQSMKEAEEKNSTCPKCKGWKVIDIIADTTGSGSSGFFYGGYVSIRTMAVNKCKHCGNEWHKAEPYLYDWEANIRLALMRLVYNIRDNGSVSHDNNGILTGIHGRAVILLVRRFLKMPYGDDSYRDIIRNKLLRDKDFILN